MKRIFSIALLTVFIFSTVGIIASSYCCRMGGNTSKEKMNSCCNMMKKNCCDKKEVKLLKVKDDFVSPAGYSVHKNFSSLTLLNTQVVFENHFQFSNFLFSEDDHAPPEKILVRLAFIQSFLI